VNPAGRVTDANSWADNMAAEDFTAGFMLRWECTCAGCLGQIHKGDRAHDVDSLLCHIGCRPAPRFRVEIKPKPPQAFTQNGKREPSLCTHCFTYHAGECL
jgi:hypothetical protein